MFHKASLFSGNIRENINYGSLKNFNDEEIIEALKIAQAWDFVQKLPEDLNEKVSQGGKIGGQTTFDCAKAIVSKAPILIFDDSFSALDYETDSKLRNELYAKKQNRKQNLSLRNEWLQLCKLTKLLFLMVEKLQELAFMVNFQNNEIYREIALRSFPMKKLRRKLKAFKKQKPFQKLKKYQKSGFSFEKNSQEEFKKGTGKNLRK